MEFAVMIEPQEGLGYADIRNSAAAAESHGFSALYRSDHYTSTLGRESAATDAWATIAGLTRDVPRIALGTLVSPVTFRPAPVLAKMAATAAEMAGPGLDGQTRVHVGLGTGWHVPEHEQYGFSLGDDVGHRFGRLEDHLRALNMLWHSPHTPCYLDTPHVRLRDPIFRPLPRPRPRIIVGGRGVHLMPVLAARYADELNALFLAPDRLKQQHNALERACEQADRDPSAVIHSALCKYIVGSTDRELQDRVASAHRFLRDRRTLADFARYVQDNWLFGYPDDVAFRIDQMRSSGAGKLVFHHIVHDDDDALALLASEVTPRLS